MLNTVNKNFKILALAISALFVGVEAQTVTCDSTSPQCCWVVLSWQFFGKDIPPSILPTDSSCCTLPMAGVTCDSTKTTVTAINWSGQSLKGRIPAELGNNLPNLTSLILSSNQFSGTIPVEIGNLKSLKILNLNAGGFSGTIPPEIGNLVNLELLDLGSNLLSGAVPSSIGNLTKLKTLLFRSCIDQYGRFGLQSFPPEIGNLVNLETLELFNNKFSDLPPEIGKLTKLQYLSMVNNAFVRNSPSEIGNMTSLRELWGVQGLGPWIGKLTNLVKLGRCANVTYIPPEIGNLQQLSYIWIYGQTGLTSLPSEMGNLKSLVTLDIQNQPRLTGVYNPRCGSNVLVAGTQLTLGDCVNYCGASSTECCWVIRTWQLMGKPAPANAIVSDDCCSMVGVTCSGPRNNITGIRWANQNLTGSIPKDISNIVSLKKLHLHNNSLSGPIPTSIATLPNLLELAVYNNTNLSGKITPKCGTSIYATNTSISIENAGITSCVNVLNTALPDDCTGTSHQCCWVVLSWQFFGKDIPPSILPTDSSCCTLPMVGVTCDSTKTTVTAINWSGQSLKGRIPAELGKHLPNLTSLILSRNQFSGAIPVEIGNLKSLKILNLNAGGFSGTIPPEIGNLVNLELLDLGSNLLSGAVPSSIGNLTKLKTLLFRSCIDQYGRFGLQSFPPEIGNLVNLETLELFNNKFSDLPPEIGKLTKLQYLSMANNAFVRNSPSEIGNMTSLRELVGVQGLGPWIGKLTNLVTLARCANVTYIPPEIGNLQQLSYIWIYGQSGLTSLPSEMGNLKSLLTLDIQNQPRLTGNIPKGFENSVNLRNLILNANQLNGKFTPQCSTAVSVKNTSVTLCGCATSGSPPTVFPPPNTTLECLATGPSSSLTKKALVFSQNIYSYRFTCNTDGFGNPYQDCLNALAAICNPFYISGNQSLIQNCKVSIDSVMSKLSFYWKNVRTNCGPWSSNGFIGDVTSVGCLNANNALISTARYIVVVDPNDRTKDVLVRVDSDLTNSVNALLWSNPVLK